MSEIRHINRQGARNPDNLIDCIYCHRGSGKTILKPETSIESLIYEDGEWWQIAEGGPGEHVLLHAIFGKNPVYEKVTQVPL